MTPRQGGDHSPSSALGNHEASLHLLGPHPPHTLSALKEVYKVEAPHDLPSAKDSFPTLRPHLVAFGQTHGVCAPGRVSRYRLAGFMKRTPDDMRQPRRRETQHTDTQNPLTSSPRSVTPSSSSMADGDLPFLLTFASSLRSLSDGQLGKHVSRQDTDCGWHSSGGEGAGKLKRPDSLFSFHEESFCFGFNFELQQGAEFFLPTASHRLNFSNTLTNQLNSTKGRLNINNQSPDRPLALSFSKTSTHGRGNSNHQAQEMPENRSPFCQPAAPS